jgi:hypothetical protein
MAKKIEHEKTELEDKLITILKRTIKDGVAAKEMSYKKFKSFYKDNDYLYQYIRRNYGTTPTRFANFIIVLVADGRLFYKSPTSIVLRLMHYLRVIKEVNDEKFTNSHYRQIQCYLTCLSRIRCCGDLNNEKALLKANSDFISSTIQEFYGDKYSKDSINCIMDLLDIIGSKNIAQELPL